jgi:hypothetical protein
MLPPQDTQELPHRHESSLAGRLLGGIFNVDLDYGRLYGFGFHHLNGYMTS